jgi:hypothetical protein
MFPADHHTSHISQLRSFDHTTAGSSHREKFYAMQAYQQKREREALSVERRAANGNYIAYACGPILGRSRYINERIELELVDFKKEIEEKFAGSAVNANFKFPRQELKAQKETDKLIIEGRVASISNKYQSN